MGVYVDVFITAVHCREPETISSAGDDFALAGAVITGQTAHPFVMPDQIMKRNTSQTFGAYRHVFSGFSDTRTIGLALRAWDIDNNDQWARNRETIEEWSNRIGELAKNLPVVGTAVQVATKVIPAAVDYFVSMDNNDELMNIARDVTLPDGPPYQTMRHWVEARASRSDDTGYSDWDYSLDILFEYTIVMDAPFGGSPRAKFMPWDGTEVEDWVGLWESARVSCEISPSPRQAGMLDVTLTLRSEDSPSLLQFNDVPITRLYIEAMLEPPAMEPWGPDLTIVAGKPIQKTGLNARIVAEHSHGRSVVRDQVLGAPNGPLSMSADVAAIPRSIASQAMIPPALRQQSGGDILQLGIDTVLEAYQERGGPAGANARLRFLRPVVNVMWRSGAALDEWLLKRIV